MVSLRPLSDVTAENADDLIKLLKATLQDLEDQLNEKVSINTSTNGTIPKGLKQDDVLFLFFGGKISIYVKGKAELIQLTAAMLGGIMQKGTNFTGVQSANVAPVAANFPQPNDWGFFEHIGTAFYFCFNLAGVLKKVALT